MPNNLGDDVGIHQTECAVRIGCVSCTGKFGKRSNRITVDAFVLL